MLHLEMLSAAHGDALLIEYGPVDAPYRILIDGGPYFAYDDPGGLRERLQALQDSGATTFQLLVITHVDTDHIDGIIRLLQDPELAEIRFNDIWFNDWKHLEAATAGILAGVQGEFLGALLEHRDLPWNNHPNLSGNPIVVPDTGPLPVFNLNGDATITLLSPGPAQLDNLKKNWRQSVRHAGFTPGDRAAALAELEQRARYGPPPGVLGGTEDDSPANGSSIAFILEHGGERLLLAGDAWPTLLEKSLVRYAQEHESPIKVLDFKLPHHGSFSNLNKNIIKALRPDRYLVSSSSQYYGHPDADAIELILKHHEGDAPTFVFNYLSPKTAPWADATRQQELGYTVSFPTGARWGG
ncbi:MAG: hypothetical protein KQH59_19205 [Desulfobulbaceae bacterium]|nr:hypothetical protein [Desulfobulbaceae bacterium]